MDPIWKTLPEDLTDKVCNSLIHVRRIDPALKEEIVNQWYKFETYFWRILALFGPNNVYRIMYDDMVNIAGMDDDGWSDDEDLEYRDMVYMLWERMTHEERNEVMVSN